MMHDQLIKTVEKGNARQIEIGEEPKPLRIMTANAEKKLVAHIKNTNKFGLLSILY